jgi:hypothetical protein
MVGVDQDADDAAHQHRDRDRGVADGDAGGGGAQASDEPGADKVGAGGDALSDPEKLLPAARRADAGAHDIWVFIRPSSH